MHQALKMSAKAESGNVMSSFRELMDEILGLEQSVDEIIDGLEKKQHIKEKSSQHRQAEMIQGCHVGVRELRKDVKSIQDELGELKELSFQTTRAYVDIQREFSDVCNENVSDAGVDGERDRDDEPQECLHALLREKNAIQDHLARVREYFGSSQTTNSLTPKTIIDTVNNIRSHALAQSSRLQRLKESFDMNEANDHKERIGGMFMDVHSTHGQDADKAVGAAVTNGHHHNDAATKKKAEAKKKRANLFSILRDIRCEAPTMTIVSERPSVSVSKVRDVLQPSQEATVANSPDDEKLGRVADQFDSRSNSSNDDGKSSGFSTRGNELFEDSLSRDMTALQKEAVHSGKSSGTTISQKTPSTNGSESKLEAPSFVPLQPSPGSLGFNTSKFSANTKDTAPVVPSSQTFSGVSFSVPPSKSSTDFASLVSKAQVPTLPGTFPKSAVETPLPVENGKSSGAAGSARPTTQTSANGAQSPFSLPERSLTSTTTSSPFSFVTGTDAKTTENITIAKTAAAPVSVPKEEEEKEPPATKLGSTAQLIVEQSDTDAGTKQTFSVSTSPFGSLSGVGRPPTSLFSKTNEDSATVSSAAAKSGTSLSSSVSDGPAPGGSFGTSALELSLSSITTTAAAQPAQVKKDEAPVTTVLSSTSSLEQAKTFDASVNLVTKTASPAPQIATTTTTTAAPPLSFGASESESPFQSGTGVFGSSPAPSTSPQTTTPSLSPPASSTTVSNKGFMSSSFGQAGFGQSSMPAPTSPFGTSASAFTSKSSGTSAAFGQSTSPSPTSSSVSTNAFGTTGSFGADVKSATSGAGGLFGQASSPGSSGSSFGQPSSFGVTSAFGKASTPASVFGQQSSFGQQASGGGGGQATTGFGAFGGGSFGKPALPGAGATGFGQAAAPGAGGGFGQAAAPGAGGGFGQAAAPGAGGGFGGFSSSTNAFQQSAPSAPFGGGNTAFGGANAFSSLATHTGSSGGFGAGSGFGASLTMPQAQAGGAQWEMRDGKKY